MQFKSQDRLGRDTNILRGEKETDYVNVPRLKEVKPKQQLLVTRYTKLLFQKNTRFL